MPTLDLPEHAIHGGAQGSIYFNLYNVYYYILYIIYYIILYYIQYIYILYYIIYNIYIILYYIQYIYIYYIILYIYMAQKHGDVDFIHKQITLAWIENV